MIEVLPSRSRAACDPISFAQPKEIGERKGCPAAALSFGLSATLVRLRNSDFQSSNSPRRLTQLMLKP
jgi:hypothetical protein